jgi:NAD-dependent SIR2 family protein deacetylase
VIGSVPPAVRQLAEWVRAGGVTVLSGAGISTESGIPDYRGPGGSLARRTPMTYQAFTADPAARQRYWARSHLGWRSIARAVPNPGHHAVAALQRHGLLAGVITQNVDGLHQAAGAHPVVELHGSLDQVRCLRCGDRISRDELDRRLREANPDFAARVEALNADGDAELADAQLTGFRVVDCQLCGGGLLKPDVVFFGESVPADRVAHCVQLVGRSRLLLVLGSSLTVYSGRRFVNQAARAGTLVAIVNQGATRGDEHAALRLDGPLGELLPQLVGLAAGTPVRTPAA